jgi:hypothetical protein
MVARRSRSGRESRAPAIEIESLSLGMGGRLSMRRVVFRASALALAVACLPAPFGCGVDNATSTAERSAEHKKADEAGRKAVMEFMKKGGPKKAASSGRAY